MGARHSAAGRSEGMFRREEKRVMSTWRSARWLAKKELRRTWLSYILTALVALLFGLFAIQFLNDLQTVTSPDRAASAAVDIFFVFGLSALATNAFSRDYLYSLGDSFSKRLYFLRSLPISIGALVASRPLTMLLALALNSLVFFAAIRGISGSSGVQIVQRLGTGEYLTFAGIWLGYVLVCAGAWLYGEFGLHGRTFNWITIGIMAFVFVLLVLAETLLDVRIVLTTIQLAEAYGPLLGLPVLFFGVLALTLSGWATGWRLKRRDLTP